jgi:hypothetical protein
MQILIFVAVAVAVVICFDVEVFFVNIIYTVVADCFAF